MQALDSPNTPIPFIGGAGTIRDDILAVLSSEYPLSVKEIHNRIKRKTGKEITYQAVHKTIHQLIENKVIEKNGTAYRISSQWIEQIKDYIAIIEYAYQKGKEKPIIDIQSIKEPITLEFQSFTELSTYTAKMLAKANIEDKEKSANYALIRHTWWPLKFDFSHYDLLKKMDDGNPHNRVVVTQNSPLDKYAIKYYRLVGNNKAKAILGTKDKEHEKDLIVKNDIVIQVTFSPETIAFLDEIYENTHGLAGLFGLYFQNKKKDEKLKIKVTIERNQTLAKIVKEKIKRYFGEK